MVSMVSIDSAGSVIYDTSNESVLSKKNVQLKAAAEKRAECAETFRRSESVRFYPGF
jgi:hypothetical protein